MTSNGKLIKDAMDAAGKDRETKQHPPKGRSVSSKNILPKQIVKMTPYATGGSVKRLPNYDDGGGIFDTIKSGASKVRQAVTNMIPNNALSLGRMAAASAGLPAGNFVNKNDFSKEQLKMIYDAAQAAQKRNNSPHGGTSYSDYGQEYGNIWNRGIGNVIKDSFVDPRFQVATTLGRFSYNMNPDNSLDVGDIYDFNNENKGFLSNSVKALDQSLGNDPRKKVNFKINPNDFKKYGGQLPMAANGSIVDYLDSIGQDSSKEARAALAQKLGVANYNYSESKNNELLNMLINSKKSVSKADSTKTNQNKLDSNKQVLKPGASNQTEIRPTNGYMDIQKNYNLDPLSKEGIEKAKQLEALYPGTKFICTAEGCAQIAGKAADAYGQHFSKGNAWDYGNINDVTFQNPAYANLITGTQGVLPNPKSYKVPQQILNSSNQIIGLNRKNNLIDAMGNRLPDTKQNKQKGATSYKQFANDSYDYANPELYPNSRGYEHVGYSLGNHQLLHGTGKSKDHPAFYVVDNMDNGVDLSGYGQYEPVEAMNPSNAPEKAASAVRQGYSYLKNLVGLKKGGSTFSGNAWYKGGGSTFSGNAWYGDGGNFYAATPNFIQDAVFDIYKMYGGDAETGGEQMKEGGIHINPANKGKFNATKQRTGKSTEELTHSSNPVTRKRAIFAQNAAKWHHADGGPANVSLPPLSKEMQQQMQEDDNAYMTAPVDLQQQAQQQAETAWRQQYPNAPINAPISDWSNTQFSSQQVNPFTSNLPDAQVVTKNQRYANKMNKLSDGLMNQTFGNPFSLYNMARTASNVVGGINNHKQMKEDISRENFNYSTMGMNPIADPGDGSKGFRPVSGTQRNKEIPNRIGGNYSFNGMNQANYNPYRAALGLSVDNVFSPGESYSVPEQQYMGGNEMPQQQVPQQVPQAGPSAPDMTNAPAPAAANAGSYNDVASFIKKMEGFQKKASWDYAQNSVGYGSKAKHAGEIITREEAEQRLNQELQPIIEKIQSKVKVPLTQGQLMALASINYNTGSLANSLIKELNNGADPKEIEQRIKTMALTGVGSKKILPGLVNRRKEEAALFGRGYADGGVVELTGDQIMQIRAMGGDVEFID